jgi:DNA (cytosine-5)-methyltransferase 3A
MRNFNIFSGFDGKSGGQLAIKNIGMEKYNYFASEINEKSIKVAMDKYPNTIQLGTITKINIKTIYLSEVFNYISKKYFKNGTQGLQSIISERELLHRINEEQSFAAYFGTQDKVKKSKVSKNTTLSINDRIWFFRNPMDDNCGIYDIIRGGERRAESNSINFGKLLECSFWWNGYGQQKSFIKGESFKRIGWSSGNGRNETEIKDNGEKSIFLKGIERTSKIKGHTAISRPTKERELFNRNEELGQKINGGKEKENGTGKKISNVQEIKNPLRTFNENDGAQQDYRDFLWFYSQIQATVVECEWGVIIFKGTFDITQGGSPCQNFSFAGNHKGMSTKDNIEITSLEKYLELKEKGFEFEGQSYLFWEYVRIVEESKPKYFLLENVKMAKKWENIISNELGVKPIRINSNLLTAQNRDRLYWTNIPGIEVPEDSGILLGDVVDGAVSGFGTRGRKKKGEETYSRYSTIRKDQKSNCLTKGGTCRKYVDELGEVHNLTVEDCEVLQGVPVGYTDVIGVTKTDRYQMLGNGWTVPVIEHIFSFVPEFELVEV